MRQTAVHEAYLGDLLWPHRVVGKHTVYARAAAGPSYQIFLDVNVTGGSNAHNSAGSYGRDQP